MLKLYSTKQEESLMKTGDGYLPFTLSFDGRDGGAQIKQIYLKGDNPDRYYTNIELVAVDVDGHVDTGGLSWSWKLFYSDIEPTATVWNYLADGNTLSLPDIGAANHGDAHTILGIWVRVQVPRHTPGQTIKSISLTLSYKEHAAYV